MLCNTFNDEQYYAIYLSAAAWLNHTTSHEMKEKRNRLLKQIIGLRFMEGSGGLCS